MSVRQRNVFGGINRIDIGQAFSDCTSLKELAFTALAYGYWIERLPERDKHKLRKLYKSRRDWLKDAEKNT